MVYGHDPQISHHVSICINRCTRNTSLWFLEAPCCTHLCPLCASLLFVAKAIQPLWVQTPQARVCTVCCQSFLRVVVHRTLCLDMHTLFFPCTLIPTDASRALCSGSRFLGAFRVRYVHVWIYIHLRFIVSKGHMGDSVMSGERKIEAGVDLHVYFDTTWRFVWGKNLCVAWI